MLDSEFYNETISVRQKQLWKILISILPEAVLCYNGQQSVNSISKRTVKILALKCGNRFRPWLFSQDYDLQILTGHRLEKLPKCPIKSGANTLKHFTS